MHQRKGSAHRPMPFPSRSPTQSGYRGDAPRALRARRPVARNSPPPGSSQTGSFARCAWPHRASPSLQPGHETASPRPPLAAESHLCRACRFSRPDCPHRRSPLSSKASLSWATRPSARRSTCRHSLVGELPDRFLVLCQVRQPHAPQYVRRLGELDIVIPDDLDPIAPGIAEIKKAPRQHLHPRFAQRNPHSLLVIHDKPEMPPIIRRLPPAFLQSQELIAKIDEGGVFALAAQLELKEAAVERQRLIDVTHLERDVIEANRASLLSFSHGTLQVLSFMWSADSASTIAPRCSAHESPLRSHKKCTPLREHAPPPARGPSRG